MTEVDPGVGRGALPAPSLRLSSAEGRAAIVAAELPDGGLADARAALGHLGAIQLDPISRVERAHRLTAIARLSGRGRVGAERLDGSLWPVGQLACFEGITHAMCLIPIEQWPLWAGRRRRAAERLAERDPDGESRRLLELVAGAAPGVGIGLAELEDDAERTTGWNWSRTKELADRLVQAGELVVDRAGGVRRYELAERRVPSMLLEEQVDEDAADEALARIALRAHGILTVADLARRLRLPRPRALAVARRLADAGIPIAAIDGWGAPALVDPTALERPAPRGVVWIGPFDSLLWDRPRALRVLGIDYRFEAYVPPPQRIHGPYAMLGLVDGRAVTLGDLRADRKSGRLELLRTSPLPGRPPLARALGGLAGFARRLGLAGGVVDLR